MKEILAWLKTVEDKAMLLYDKASTVFPDDPELTDLFTRLATDEEFHFDLIERAEGFFERSPELIPLVVFDDKVKKRIDACFKRCWDILGSDKPERKELMNVIVRIEYSEVNDLFLYAFNMLKDKSEDFKDIDRVMAEHKGLLEKFFESRPEYSNQLKAVRAIPDLWQEKILVVDDSDVIVDVLKNILVSNDAIVVARTSDEAITKLEKEYFSAVITEARTREIDGIAFYKEAERRYPGFKDKVLFFTAAVEADIIYFLKSNRLKHLQKPSPIGEIKRAVMEILLR